MAALDAANKEPKKTSFRRTKGATEALIPGDKSDASFWPQRKPGAAWYFSDPHHTIWRLVDRWREHLQPGSQTANISNSDGNLVQPQR